MSEPSQRFDGTISVVIPTHERAELVVRAIESVLGQTRAADEIIVIDDGSRDETRDRIAALDADIRYVWQAQAGVSAARNRGLDFATGEWIALLDSDDEWRPRKLARQVEALGADPEARICHTDEIWIRRGRRVNPMRKHEKRGGRIFRRCLPLCAISPSSVMMHREVFDRVGRFDEELPACEDYDLWLRVCSRFDVLFIDEPLVVKYGGHDDQLSRRYWGMDRFRIRALERVLGEVELDADDRRAAFETLLKKIDIYRQGAAKRGRHDEAATYADLRDRVVARFGEAAVSG